MKTLFLKESNGIKIIVGFGNAAIDPEETKKKVNLLLVDTQIGKDVNAKADEIREIVISADAAMKNFRQCSSTNDKVGAATHYQEYLDFEPIHKTKEQELGLILPDLEKKRLELYEKEAIYFEPKKGEVLVSPELFELIKDEIKGLSENECIEFTQSPTGTTTTEKIPNFIGCTYFILVGSVWEKHEITLVGVPIPTGGILVDDLTDVQKMEIDLQELVARIATLTQEEKAAELQTKTDKLVIEAAAKRSILEIQKVATALEDSQAWYDVELAKLTALYA